MRPRSPSGSSCVRNTFRLQAHPALYKTPAAVLGQYAYNHLNQRVWRLAAEGSTTTEEIYFYGVDGQRLASYTLAVGLPSQGDGNIATLTAAAADVQVYFGHKLVQRGAYSATAQGEMSAEFLGQDMVGSVRTDGSGNWSNFYPWGVEQGTATGNDRVKFGTYTRDGEAGLDYAMNRYYNSLTGRFLTPDPYGGSADSGNPGSWNRYAYMNGSPASGSDPSGLYFGGAGGFGGAGFGGGGMGDPGGAGCQINDYSNFFDSGFDPYNGANGTVCSPFGAYGLWYFNAPMPGGGGGGQPSYHQQLKDAFGSVQASLKSAATSLISEHLIDCWAGMESNFNPKAANSGHEGLFQLNSDAWAASGIGVAFSSANIFNAATNAVAAVDYLMKLITNRVGATAVGAGDVTAAQIAQGLTDYRWGASSKHQNAAYADDIMNCAKDLGANNWDAAMTAIGRK